MMFTARRNRKLYMQEAERLISMLNFTIRQREAFRRRVEKLVAVGLIDSDKARKDVKWALRSFLSQYTPSEALEIVDRMIDKNWEKITEDENLMARGGNLTLMVLKKSAIRNGYGTKLIRIVIDVA